MVKVEKFMGVNLLKEVYFPKQNTLLKDFQVIGRTEVSLFIKGTDPHSCKIHKHQVTLTINIEDVERIADVPGLGVVVDIKSSVDLKYTSRDGLPI